jgi:hypothetical protein
MTVTLAIRFLVASPEVGMTEAKRSKTMWMRAGAKAYRCHQFFTGEFQGQWLFHLDFDDLAQFQKSRDSVMKSEDLKTITANNAKAGNTMVAREVLFGVDL